MCFHICTQIQSVTIFVLIFTYFMLVLFCVICIDTQVPRF